MKTRSVGPFEWEVPIGETGGMRVPGRVFADAAAIEKAREDRALEQVANVATLPGIVRASYAMPDIHWGYGFPVGGVAATDVDAGGVISPGGVGFDICCGVRLLRSDLTMADVRDRITELSVQLGRRIPRGVGKNGILRLDRSELRGVLTEGAAWVLGRGLGWESDLERSEDHGRLEGADPNAVSDRAYERGAPQCGSLGAGNHFLEVQVVDLIADAGAAEAFELAEGTVCVMLHSGSRGVGHQVCTDQLKIFDKLMRRSGIEVPDRQLACGPVSTPEAERYLGAMAAAANFARANRHAIAHEVRETFAAVVGRSAEDMGMRLVYDVAHNLAKIERYEVDGRERDLCVHRKGATRAFGPGHPELVDRYKAVGQPVIVPGSMGTESWVLVGTTEGREKAFWSTCHGAGRAMSRTQAKKRMGGHQVRSDLEAQGILVNATHPGLLAEEAPYAYKDVTSVVDTCEGAGLSKKVARLRPLAVIKG
jgi:tRNA-splicing ligase RtcB (3'-phosphate/5'-hydroxy nucleic acid ligase)